MTQGSVEQRKVEYLTTIRNLHKGKRTAGMVGCAIGVLILAVSTTNRVDLDWLRYVGLAVIAASWLLFLYVIVSRTRYVRSHPFDAGN